MLDEYKKREPDGHDAWNLLGNEKELWHRVRLLIALKWALEKIPVPVEEMKVLDVGCGVGRSSRALLEFGIRPENVVGIDLRPGTIDYARKINPAISYRLVNDFADWPEPATFHLCMQCTAFSSIEGNDRRLKVGQMMEAMLIDNGYIFWWDRIRANKFAGYDNLIPSQFFTRSSLVGGFEVSLRPSIKESLRSQNRFIYSLVNILEPYFGYGVSHLVSLFEKCQVT